jgi:3'(2'), 5'-bisphosphate nucleotidase
MSLDDRGLIEELLPLVEHAGRDILHYYEDVKNLEVQRKADRSPLTAADLASHDILDLGLRRITPEIPILSEEADIPPLAERKDWPLVWLVDPLDGTREFIDANDQFCINIALVENGAPRLGIIHSPVLGISYCGIPGIGAWKVERGETSPLLCRSFETERTLTLVSSSRRFNDEMLALEDHLSEQFGKVQRLCLGSAMKFCRVAQGEADIYPCFGPTSEWDTAAGQAIVEAAGGMMLSLDFQPFLYNRNETVLNRGFYLLADRSYDWLPVLRETAKSS